MTKIWFITGSSRGLGRSLVEAVLASGDHVAATARNAADLSQLVEKYGPEKILAESLDVTNVEQVSKAVQSTLSHFGRIDVVVNNAGYADTASIEDMTQESFRAQFETNFFGVVNVTKAVIPILREQKSGHILQVSSIGGRMGSPGLGAYQSAKWALAGFSTVLSQEVAPFGVRVTVLEPGGMKTDWGGSSMGYGHMSEPYEQTVGAFNEIRMKLSADTPPERIAAAILHVVGSPDPPLRLLLGPETPKYAKQVSEALAASDAKWEDVTMLSRW